MNWFSLFAVICWWLIFIALNLGVFGSGVDLGRQESHYGETLPTFAFFVAILFVWAGYGWPGVRSGNRKIEMVAIVLGSLVVVSAVILVGGMYAGKW